MRPRREGDHPSAGPHIVETVVGHNPPCANAPSLCTGWNIDQLVLDSAAGGAPGPSVSPTTAGAPSVPPVQAGTAPTVVQQTSHIDSQSDLVSGARQPFEFVLGQSVDKGWQAVAAPGPLPPPGSTSVDLGTSQLIDGFANGWQVSEADLQRPGRVRLHDSADVDPPKEIWAALAISGATLALCLLLGFLPSRARRWLRAKLPRRLRGPAGPEVVALATEPFDCAHPDLALLGAAQGGAPAWLAARPRGP